jgi:hypothetical protein
MPAIARPELQQVVATQLLFDFAEYVAHKYPGLGRGRLPYPVGFGDANCGGTANNGRRQPVAASEPAKGPPNEQDRWTVSRKWSK